MSKGPASWLDGLLPAIKARWAELLLTEPAAPPAANALITPAMLVFMLDESLVRLKDRLRAPAGAGRSRRDHAPFSPRRAGCQCGLHILLSYYVAGARALRENLPAEFGPARLEMIRRFNHLAHAEMTALCGVCLQRGGSLCSLQAAAVSPPSAAASRARPRGTGRSRGGKPG